MATIWLWYFVTVAVPTGQVSVQGPFATVTLCEAARQWVVDVKQGTIPVKVQPACFAGQPQAQ